MVDEKSLIATIDAFLSGDISAKASEGNALGERINRLFDLVADETAMIQKREAEFQKAFLYIRRVVAKLAQDDLFENRIDTGLLPAGLRPVGQAFNALLDKIQEMIQAQKKAIEELDSAKANVEYERTYWQEIFESSQTGMAVFDTQGRVWEANEAITEMFGYSKDEILSPHFSWGNVITPEDLPLAMERLKDLLQTGRTQKFELTYVHKNGRRVPTLISYQKLTKRPEWQTDRMIASIQDITEIKAQQAYVNDLLGLLPVGSFSFDIETAQIYSANPLLQGLLGFTEEELRQKTGFDLLSEEHHGLARERIQSALQTSEKDLVQYPLLAKDGSKIPVLISYGKVYDPCIKKDIVVAFVVDVSEIERAKAKMELLLKLSPVAICEWRPGGELLSINEQYARMVGYTVEEVYAMGWKNLTAPEYQGDPDRLHEENVLNGTDKTYQKEYIHKDGHRVPIYLVTEPVFKQDGTVDYYISYIQDFTEIKNAQAKLEELVEAQQRTIKELSTPVIPVWSRVIMAPLLGSFDSVRMHDLSERLLEEVASKKPRAVLLDLSGLAFVDTQVVSEILRLVTSVRLLGARTILSGIGPVVAQSLVRLGATLDGAPTYTTLEQGLRSVIGDSGHARR
jgi:PAS domain S-box-containing protein